MPKKLSKEQGTELVKLARKSIEYTLATGKTLSEICPNNTFLEQRGVFVTLNTHPEKELRGCIGFPYPTKPVWGAIIEASVQAALHDPRFPQLEPEELEKTTIEISVLTKPEEITIEKKEIPKSIKTGEDGLIIQRSHNSGLLLPQVASEQGWKAETFLEACSEKAGLLASMWKSSGTKILKFQAQVFSETMPQGTVEETA